MNEEYQYVQKLNLLYTKEYHNYRFENPCYYYQFNCFLFFNIERTYKPNSFKKSSTCNYFVVCYAL